MPVPTPILGIALALGVVAGCSQLPSSPQGMQEADSGATSLDKAPLGDPAAGAENHLVPPLPGTGVANQVPTGSVLEVRPTVAPKHPGHPIIDIFSNPMGRNPAGNAAPSFSAMARVVSAAEIRLEVEKAWLEKRSLDVYLENPYAAVADREAEVAALCSSFAQLSRAACDSVSKSLKGAESKLDAPALIASLNEAFKSTALHAAIAAELEYALESAMQEAQKMKLEEEARSAPAERRAKLSRELEAQRELCTRAKAKHATALAAQLAFRTLRGSAKPLHSLRHPRTGQHLLSFDPKEGAGSGWVDEGKIGSAIPVDRGEASCGHDFGKEFGSATDAVARLFPHKDGRNKLGSCAFWAQNLGNHRLDHWGARFLSLPEGIPNTAPLSEFENAGDFYYSTFIGAIPGYKNNGSTGLRIYLD